jgi:hypothetical protein
MTPTRSSTDRFSPFTESARRLGRDIIIALVASIVSFFLLRPDWYFWQNGLDPFFYTGYTQNFDDILPTIGARHYFVSRWALYLPSRLFFEVVGADAGFVAFRLSLLAVAIVALWNFGRSWRIATRSLVAVVVLTSPMVIRSIFTDYSDAIVVPLGVVLICTLFAERPSRVGAGVAGIAAALMVVANPLSLAIVGLAVGAWAAYSFGRRWQAAIDLAVITTMFTAVVLFGLVVFRWRYGIANVYEPTLDFIRSNEGRHDALKSPDTRWLEYRLWIYLPPITVAVALLFHALRRSRLERREGFVIAVAGLQYCYQWWYQFAQDGSTLEIQYYWSYMLPAYLVAVAVVLRQLSGQLRPEWIGGTIAVLLVGTLALPTPAPSIWPTVLPAAVIVVAAMGLVSLPILSRHGSIGALVVFVIITSTIQFGSPRPEPRRDGELRVESAYESAFGATTSPGQRTFHAVTDFGSRLDRFGNDVERQLHFWLGGAESWQLSALYGAPVSGRVVNFDERGVALDVLPVAWAERIHSGRVSVVAVLGSPEQTAGFIEVLRDAGPPDFVVLDDVTFTTTMPTRLVLVQLVTSLPTG